MLHVNFEFMRRTTLLTISSWRLWHSHWRCGDIIYMGCSLFGTQSVSKLFSVWRRSWRQCRCWWFRTVISVMWFIQMLPYWDLEEYSCRCSESLLMLHASFGFMRRTTLLTISSWRLWCLLWRFGGTIFMEFSLSCSRITRVLDIYFLIRSSTRGRVGGWIH